METDEYSDTVRDRVALTHYGWKGKTHHQPKHRGEVNNAGFHFT